METMGTRRSFSPYGALSAVASVLAMILGLSLFDPRLRLELERLAAGRAPTGEVASLAERAVELAEVAFQAMRDQSIEHAPIVVFGLAAAVLVLFLTRA